LIHFNNNCDGSGSDPYINICFTRNCPHRCIFCCADNDTTLDVPDIEAIADSVISIGWKHVVIEGGEPLLFPKELKLFIKLIRPHVKDITMFTSLPETIKGKDDEVLKIIDLIDGTNISMLHNNFYKAHEMRGGIGECSNWRNELIKNLAKRTSNFRVSMLLTKGYLETQKDVSNALVDFYAMGVKNIKLGEISKSDLFVPLSDVFPSIDFSSPCWNGCSKLLKKPPKDLLLPGLLLNNRTLLLKQVCHLNQNKILPTIKDKLKLSLRDIKWKFTGQFNYLVIYSDGTIASSWK
jgi:organic radical activating enzyme